MEAVLAVELAVASEVALEVASEVALAVAMVAALAAAAAEEASPAATVHHLRVVAGRTNNPLSLKISAPVSKEQPSPLPPETAPALFYARRNAIIFAIIVQKKPWCRMLNRHRCK